MHPANVRRLAIVIGAALPFLLHSSKLDGVQSTNDAFPTTTTATAIEWDLPTEVDFLPGAVVTDKRDGNRLWFVTRLGVENPFVYRVDLKTGKKVNSADVFGWPLDSTSLLASGLRRLNTSHDGRFVFVRTTFSLQRIDVGGCKSQASIPYLTSPSVVCDLTVWENAGTDEVDPAVAAMDTRTGSDIAIDEYRNVFSVVGVLGDQTVDPEQPIRSFVERLNPDSKYKNVDRWYVGGDAGICNFAAFSAPCLSGVAISPHADHLVYYAEPTGGDGTGAIGELNPSTNTVRRWPFTVLNAGVDPLSADIVQEPRQIQFDSDGTLWAVTGSGHLVSLDPKRNRLTRHATPGHAPAGTTTDTFGVAPDGGVIGYTDSHVGQNNVAMLLPKAKYVPFTPKPEKVVRRTFTNGGRTDPVTRIERTAEPTPKKYIVTRTPQSDGIFVEADTMTSLINPITPSFSPSGITPDRNGSVGTFFYAIGDSGGLTNRFGRIRLPRDGVRARVERDDDDHDDDGKRDDVDDDKDDDGKKDSEDLDDDDDGHPDGTDDDDDNDGIEDQYDTPNGKESKQTSSQTAAAGESVMDQFTVNPGTLVAVATATSSNALAPVSVEIVNAAGQVVSASISTPGAAVLTWTPPAAGGVFTLRVRNQSVGAVTLSTRVLMREPWSLF
jgi:hypothetical protein